MLNVTKMITGASSRRKPPLHPQRPVVVWNVTKRCNLKCEHCYAASKDTYYPDELTKEEAREFIKDLAAYRVPALILSGGEPLLRDDIFELASLSSKLGVSTALSTNGTLITEELAKRIRDSGIYYVGISIDGDEPTHDAFRGQKGSFRRSIDGIRACLEAGIKVGLRFTMTRKTIECLPFLIELALKEGCHRLYLSHLVYVGRGRRLSADALSPDAMRNTMDVVFNSAERILKENNHLEIVTGNNDVDGIYLYYRYLSKDPHLANSIYLMLEARGGNTAGRLIASVDSFGNVHPDQYWSLYRVGNIRERRFSELWSDEDQPLLKSLRDRLGLLKGRCRSCIHRRLCAGNSRIRARHFYGDLWAEDPACYLTNTERGINTDTLEAI